MFCSLSNIECASAGLSADAQTPVSSEWVVWADLIFVMEKVHKAKLSARFKPLLSGKRVVCLGIPDNYKFMDPALIKILEAKVKPYLT